MITPRKKYVRMTTLKEVLDDEIIEIISHCILSAKDRLRWYESTNRKSYLTEANDYLEVMREYVAQINEIYR
jgi:uncharacterized protein YqeY